MWSFMLLYLTETLQIANRWRCPRCKNNNLGSQMRCGACGHYR